MKLKALVLAAALCILSLTGCWDRRELNELGIVLAFAIDKKDHDGKILVTAQIVRPDQLKQNGGGGEKSSVELVSAEGDTVFDAIRNISKNFDRRVYFAHSKIVIVDEELAKEGLLPVLDFITRSRELRRLTWLVVAKDTTAQSILGIQHGIENIQASYLEAIIKRRQMTSEASVLNVLEFLKRVPSNQISPVAGVMEITEEETLPIEEKREKTTQGIKLSGTAVFYGDKLVGYLDDLDTRGYNWVAGKVEGGKLDIPSPEEKGNNISTEITSAKSSIKPMIKDGEISFRISIKQESDIVGQEGSTVVSELEIFEKIEKVQEEIIKKEVEKTIDKVQKEFKSDIFGFGSELNKKYPKEWEKVKDDWYKIFPRVKYTVEVKTSFKRTGLLQKPIKVPAAQEQ